MSLNEYIWFEKYRPKTIRAISLAPDHRVAFEKYIGDGNIPHLLLEGPPGSGKTTIAYILIGAIPCTSIVLNASGEDRGIDTMRGKVKQFAMSQSMKKGIKIVFLDESDAMSRDAQTALRNTMETYSANCRFILTCNYVDKIIPPLQSRCTRFTFDRFPKTKMIKLCETILRKEGISDVSMDDLGALVKRYYPDIRSVINNLQLACVSGKLDLAALTVLKADPDQVGKLIMSGKVFSLRTYVAGITDFAFLYRWMFDEFIANHGNDAQKADMVQHLAQALSVDQQVPDRELNFIACCLNIIMTLEVEVKFNV